eukprot:Gb_25436 [translate_table: standard]
MAKNKNNIFGYIIAFSHNCGGGQGAEYQAVLRGITFDVRILELTRAFLLFVCGSIRELQGAGSMASVNWKDNFSVESRRSVLDIIVESLLKYKMLLGGSVCMSSPCKVALLMEMRAYVSAAEENDYYKKIAVILRNVIREGEAYAAGRSGGVNQNSADPVSQSPTNNSTRVQLLQNGYPPVYPNRQLQSGQHQTWVVPNKRRRLSPVQQEHLLRQSHHQRSIVQQPPSSRLQKRQHHVSQQAQPSVLQSANQSVPQISQPALEKNLQSAPRQHQHSSILQKQRPSMVQQSTLLLQQRHLMGQQNNPSNMKQSQDEHQAQVAQDQQCQFQRQGLQAHHQQKQQTAAQWHKKLTQQHFNPESLPNLPSHHIDWDLAPQISQQSSPITDPQALVSLPLHVCTVGSPMKPATSALESEQTAQQHQILQQQKLPQPALLVTQVKEQQLKKRKSSSSASSTQLLCATSFAQVAEQSFSSSMHISQVGTPKWSATPTLGLEQKTSNSTSQSLASGTPIIPPALAKFSPRPAENIVNQVKNQGMGDTSSVIEPFHRVSNLINSDKALNAPVDDMGSMVFSEDMIATTPPSCSSRDPLTMTSVAIRKCCFLERNPIPQDANAIEMKTRQSNGFMPIRITSSDESVSTRPQQHNNPVSAKTINPVVQDEIQEINQGLKDTVVAISTDDNDAAEARDGIVVKIFCHIIESTPGIMYHHKSNSVILPLHLLIPMDYPNSSPIILEKDPDEPCKEHEDLTSKAKVKFKSALCTFAQPVLLKAMVLTWDVIARNVIAEYAHQLGGGSLSTLYGKWEKCSSDDN